MNSWAKLDRYQQRLWSQIEALGRDVYRRVGVTTQCGASKRWRNEPNHSGQQLTPRRVLVQIEVGYELNYELPQPTPMLLAVQIHHSRAANLVVSDYLVTSPTVPIAGYHDLFGNWITRIVAPAGHLRLAGHAIVYDSGHPDMVWSSAIQHEVQDLPAETLEFLLGSRYCETDHLSEIAWGLFGASPLGWGRVQAICDFVHNHLKFGYEHVRPTKTAWESFNERAGVC